MIFKVANINATLHLPKTGVAISYVFPVCGLGLRHVGTQWPGTIETRKRLRMTLTTSHVKYCTILYYTQAVGELFCAAVSTNCAVQKRYRHYRCTSRCVKVC